MNKTTEKIFLDWPNYVSKSEHFARFLRERGLFDFSTNDRQLIFASQQNHHKYFTLNEIAQKGVFEESKLQRIFLNKYPGVDESLQKKVNEAFEKFSTKEYEKNKYDSTSLSLFIETCKLALLTFPNPPFLLKEKLIPLFIKNYPNGSIWNIKLNFLMETRFSIMRALFSLNRQEVFNSKFNFEGFNSLKKLEMLSIVNISDFVVPLLFLFPPHVIGFSCSTFSPPKDCHILIFIFEKPVDYTPMFDYDICKINFYNQGTNRKLEWFIPKKYPLLIRDLYSSSTPHIKIVEHKVSVTFSQSQIRNLLEWWTEKLDSLFNFLLNPVNFCKEADGGKKIEPHLQFLTSLTINRIFKEMNLVEMSNHPSVPLIISFSIIDKLASLIAKGNTTEETKIFKSLVNENFMFSKIDKVCQNMPAPFNYKLRKMFKETYKELKEGVRNGLFPKDLFDKGKISLEGKTETVDEFLSNLLRAIRNTHHGYLIKDKKYLAVHDGDDILYALPKLMKFYLLWLLSESGNIINGNI